MRAAQIGFVDDVEVIGNLKVCQFRDDKYSRNNQICIPNIHMLILFPPPHSPQAINDITSIKSKSIKGKDQKTIKRILGILPKGNEFPY